MENDLLMYGDLFFDNFDDLLDFSTEETQLLQSSDDAPPPPTPPPPPISTVNNGPSETPQLPPPNSEEVANPPSDGVSAYDTDAFFCDDLDIAEMEWLSNFVEESFSTTGLSDLDTSKPNLTNNVMVNKGTIVEDDVVLNCGNKDSVSATAGAAEEQELLYLTHESPLSVLENNGNGILLGSTSSGISSSSSSTYYYSSSSSSPTTSSSCSGSMDPCRAPPPTKRPPSLVSSNPINSDDTKNEKKKKLKIKLTPMSPNGSARSFTIGNGEGGDVRKCLHCGIQKTPQWRAGPMGPKTLCNACGVRYKSGRLFPEYRPAASPTFIESVHSNSHKKVVEMRMKSNTWEEGEVEKNKKRKKRKEEEEEEEENCARPIKQVSSRCCELLNYIRSDKQWGSQEGRKDRGVVI